MTDTRTHGDQITSNITDTDSSKVRSEIDDTREHLGQTVDAIGDRVLPGRIIERRKETTANSLRGLRDRIMGTAHDTREHLTGSAGSTVDHLRDAPDSLAHRTEGSPLAAGGVAFALGFLAAAVWRPTEPERQAVEKVADAAPELAENVSQLGHEIAGSMKDSVQEQAAGVADELKSSVTDAATAVRAEAASGGSSNDINR
jgi:gas vesicle protein